MTTPREATEVTPNGGVVVGDDGSECAADAIQAAAADAQRRGCPLHVVRAWSLSTAVRPADYPRGAVPSMLEFESATAQAEKERVVALLGESADVQVHVAHGPAAKVLINASESADLVVVGIRGRGGFRDLALGSTAEQVVRHAHGPVLVIRRGRDAGS